MRDHLFGCACRRHVDRAWRRPEHWSSKEIAYLEGRYGRVSDAKIARYLGRTVTGIRLKAKRLGLRKKDSGYTATELARLMGCDSSTVSKSWIRRGGLSSIRPYRQGPHPIHIVTEAAIEQFIATRGWWIDWEKVPADSPFYDLVQRHRWYGRDAIHRLTGRSSTLNDEIRAGLLVARRRGAHWYVPESELPRIRRLPPEQADESYWRRQQVLRVRRERRRRLAVAS